MIIETGLEVGAVAVPDAAMVMGDNWSGWVWASADPHGIELFWLRYREQGQTGETWKWFKSQDSLEQYMDALDIPF